jgi:hypothetical protein
MTLALVEIEKVGLSREVAIDQFRLDLLALGCTTAELDAAGIKR